VPRPSSPRSAAVCCGDSGGRDEDDWTTCNGERDALLDTIFALAKERGLDLDFHCDENGNEEARGLRDVARAALRHGYEGRVVCGHCCSLTSQSPADLERTLELCRRARVTVVSLPMVNEWTQDRHPGRTPSWRGVTALHEVRAAGVPLALASDNTRDQFYGYGDLDMLEVLTESVRIGQLDRPTVAPWVDSVTTAPFRAMGLEGGVVREGLPADLVLFQGRRFSELLSRRMVRRAVVRGGAFVSTRLPDYADLDFDPAEKRYTRPAPPEVLSGLLHVARVLGVPATDTTLGGRFTGMGESDFSHCSHCLREECACLQCSFTRRRRSYAAALDLAAAQLDAAARHVPLRALLASRCSGTEHLGDGPAGPALALSECPACRRAAAPSSGPGGGAVAAPGEGGRGGGGSFGGFPVGAGEGEGDAGGLLGATPDLLVRRLVWRRAEGLDEDGKATAPRSEQGAKDDESVIVGWPVATSSLWLAGAVAGGAAIAGVCVGAALGTALAVSARGRR